VARARASIFFLGSEKWGEIVLVCEVDFDMIPLPCRLPGTEFVGSEGVGDNFGSELCVVVCLRKIPVGMANLAARRKRGGAEKRLFIRWSEDLKD
jgi:hypothetical protein